MSKKRSKERPNSNVSPDYKYVKSKFMNTSAAVKKLRIDTQKEKELIKEQKKNQARLPEFTQSARCKKNRIMATSLIQSQIKLDRDITPRPSRKASKKRMKEITVRLQRRTNSNMGGRS